jgi:hypothetical protein
MRNSDVWVFVLTLIAPSSYPAMSWTCQLTSLKVKRGEVKAYYVEAQTNYTLSILFVWISVTYTHTTLCLYNANYELPTIMLLYSLYRVIKSICIRYTEIDTQINTMSLIIGLLVYNKLVPRRLSQKSKD